jgi:hypothetical protein
VSFASFAKTIYPDDFDPTPPNTEKILDGLSQDGKAMAYVASYYGSSDRERLKLLASIAESAAKSARAALDRLDK